MYKVVWLTRFRADRDPNEMRRFIAANPGLASRFTKTIAFPPYSGEELCDIFQSMAAQQHFELPGRESQNAWVRAFSWVRHNTPENAYFALDPRYMGLSGEDQHGFRALAQRSALADAVKDSGAASMFPALASPWTEQVNAQKGWEAFRREDFLRLKKDYGVDWVVVQSPGVPGLPCPYVTSRLLVCRIE